MDLFSTNGIIVIVILVIAVAAFLFLSGDDEEDEGDVTNIGPSDSGNTGQFINKSGKSKEELSKLIKQKQEIKGGLRKREAKGILATIATMFDLKNLVISDKFKIKLIQAGLRNKNHVEIFSLLRIIMPISLLLISLFYNFVVLAEWDITNTQRIAISIGVCLLGYFSPGIYLTNIINKRIQELKVAIPDTLDLLLICVESGMTIELALKKVAKEISFSSHLMAEEIAIAVAELSYLQERRDAYHNLAMRTGLPEVKSMATALSQAEKYGTSIAQTLRVIAIETKEGRMAEAERKAAALPPKLTVPMILFFVPVLFGIVLGPGVINIIDKFAASGSAI